jgi:hypothetical protein
MNLMATHRWNAIGGWNTVFFGLTAGYAAQTFGIVGNTTPLTTPLIGKAGVRSVTRNAAVLFGPTTIGLVLGISLFGNATELKHLLKFSRQYRTEFNGVRNELYYQ